MAKTIDFDLGGIGDVDRILHNQGVSDLSWLSVNEDDYRASEALPKQNLDIIEDLQRSLSMEDGDDVPHIIPLKPHALVNSNPVASTVVPKDHIVKKTARYVMAGDKPTEIKSKLSLEFDPVSLKVASSEINEVVSESGLLGNVYINSAHFSSCHNLSKQDRSVVDATKRSLFVLATSKCSGCVCNQSGSCSSFKKTIVGSVNYDSRLAAHYAPYLASTNRLVKLSSEGSWKAKLQNAFLASTGVSRESEIQRIATQQVVAKRVFTPEEEASALATPHVVNDTVDSYYAKYAKRMMDGKDDRSLLVASGNPLLVKLAKEWGILGHSYVDVDVLGGCKETVRYMTSNTSKNPDYFVRRSASCGICRDHRDGGCAALSRVATFVRKVPVADRALFESALHRAYSQQRLDKNQVSMAVRNASVDADYSRLTSEVNLFLPLADTSVVRTSSEKRFSGGSVAREEVDGVSVQRHISHLMNLGMTGTTLVHNITSRYAKSDLVQLKTHANRIASLEGIQGSYFIDPSAYSDYGSGCQEGASHFRKKGPGNILASASCNGCTLQTSPGWCSRYAKTMIRSIPQEVVDSAQLRKQLSSVVETAPITNPVTDFELGSSLEVDMNGRKDRSISIDINFGSLGD